MQFRIYSVIILVVLFTSFSGCANDNPLNTPGTYAGIIPGIYLVSGQYTWQSGYNMGLTILPNDTLIVKRINNLAVLVNFDPTFINGPVYNSVCTFYTLGFIPGRFDFYDSVGSQVFFFTGVNFDSVSATFSLPGDTLGSSNYYTVSGTKIQ